MLVNYDKMQPDPFRPRYGVPSCDVKYRRHGTVTAVLGR